MRSSEPIAIEGDVVVLGFEYDLHRGRAEEEANRRDVEDVLSHLIGRPCQVRCVLARQHNPAQPISPPPTRPASEQSAAPLADGIDDDPVVQAAIDLGAQVVRRAD